MVRSQTWGAQTFVWSIWYTTLHSFTQRFVHVRVIQSSGGSSGGGGGGRLLRKIESTMCFLSNCFIRMLNNKTRIARESIKTTQEPRGPLSGPWTPAENEFSSALVMRVRAHNLLRSPPPPPPPPPCKSWVHKINLFLPSDRRLQFAFPTWPNYRGLGRSLRGTHRPSHGGWNHTSHFRLPHHDWLGEGTSWQDVRLRSSLTDAILRHHTHWSVFIIIICFWVILNSGGSRQERNTARAPLNFDQQCVSFNPVLYQNCFTIRLR